MRKTIRKFSTFVDKSKFVDEYYQVYKSTEQRNIRLLNVLYAGLIAYNAYTYYQDSRKMQIALDGNAATISRS